jgi:hypothetical protein
VSAFFKSCVDGSTVLRRIFVLDMNVVEEKQADEKLYLNPRNIHYAYDSQGGLADMKFTFDGRVCGFPTLANVRKFVPPLAYCSDPGAVTGASVSLGKEWAPELKPGSRDWKASTTNVVP